MEREVGIHVAKRTGPRTDLDPAETERVRGRADLRCLVGALVLVEQS
jgi:hypothetical protein